MRVLLELWRPKTERCGVGCKHGVTQIEDRRRVGEDGVYQLLESSVKEGFVQVVSR